MIATYSPRSMLSETPAQGMHGLAAHVVGAADVSEADEAHWPPFAAPPTFTFTAVLDDLLIAL